MGILFDTYSLINKYKGNITAVTEADKDVTPDEDDTSVDYTEEAESDIPADNTDDNNPDEDTPSDYTEEAESTEDDTGTEDEAGGESNTDDNPTDYTDEIDGGDDDTVQSTDDNDNATDSSDEQSDENKNADSRNVSLIDDMIALYYSLKSTMGKLDNYTQMSILGNKVIVQVKTNLSELLDSVFSYINDNFKKNTYAKNMYMYNAFIEAYKVNIEMLKKIELL